MCHWSRVGWHRVSWEQRITRYDWNDFHLTLEVSHYFVLRNVLEA